MKKKELFLHKNASDNHLNRVFFFFKNFPTKGTDPFNTVGYVTRKSCTI